MAIGNNANILMSNGQYKNISDIEIGDFVLSFGIVINNIPQEYNTDDCIPEEILVNSPEIYLVTKDNKILEEIIMFDLKAKNPIIIKIRVYNNKDNKDNKFEELLITL